MRRTIAFFTIFASCLLILDTLIDNKNYLLGPVKSITNFSMDNDDPDYYFPEEMIFQDIKNQYILEALIYSDLSVDDYPYFKQSGSATCIATGYIVQCFNNSNKGSLNNGVDSVIFNKPKSIGLLLKYINMS